MEDKPIEMRCKKCGKDFNLTNASHEGNLVPKCPACVSTELDII